MRKSTRVSTLPMLTSRIHKLFWTADSSPSVVLHNRTLVKINQRPPVYMIQDFLTPQELVFLHDQIGTGRFKKSYLENDGRKHRNKNRTSTFICLSWVLFCLFYLLFILKTSFIIINVVDLLTAKLLNEFRAARRK